MSQRLSSSPWWSGVLAAALSLTGCAPAGPAATPAPTPAAFRVGVVTNVGVINDQSFNQSAWEGAQAGARRPAARPITARPGTPAITSPIFSTSPTPVTT